MSPSRPAPQGDFQADILEEQTEYGSGSPCKSIRETFESPVAAYPISIDLNVDPTPHPARYDLELSGRRSKIENTPPMRWQRVDTMQGLLIHTSICKDAGRQFELF